MREHQVDNIYIYLHYSYIVIELRESIGAGKLLNFVHNLVHLVLHFSKKKL
jgi:hypothetical protein